MHYSVKGVFIMEATKCLICDGDTNSIPAKFDAGFTFIAGLSTEHTMMRFCESCKFSFVQHRDENELARYYHKVSTPEGLELKIKLHDSTLKNFFPDMWNESLQTTFHKERAERASATIKALFNLLPDQVLDFGGGRGHYGKYIFPESTVDILEVDGNLNEINKKYDFINVTHVLEHVSNPLAMLLKLKSCLTENGIIWVESPVEYEELGCNIEYTKKHWEHIAIDEHINFFSENSFVKLAEKAGFQNSVYFRQYYLKQNGVATKLDRYYKNLVVQTCVLSSASLDKSKVSAIEHDSDFGVHKKR